MAKPDWDEYRSNLKRALANARGKKLDLPGEVYEIDECEDLKGAQDRDLLHPLLSTATIDADPDLLFEAFWEVFPSVFGGRPLITFSEFGSMTVDEAPLYTVDLGDGYIYVINRYDEDFAMMAMAAVNKNNAVQSLRAYITLVISQAESEHTVFGGWPMSVNNHAPELISEDSVRAGFARSSWLDDLSMQYTFQDLVGRPPNREPLGLDDRKLLLDVYMKECYWEESDG